VIPRFFFLCFIFICRWFGGGCDGVFRRIKDRIFSNETETVRGSHFDFCSTCLAIKSCAKGICSLVGTFENNFIASVLFDHCGCTYVCVLYINALAEYVAEDDSQVGFRSGDKVLVMSKDRSGKSLQIQWHQLMLHKLYLLKKCKIIFFC